MPGPIAGSLLLDPGGGGDALQREDSSDRLEVSIAGQKLVTVAQTQLRNEAIDGRPRGCAAGATRAVDRGRLLVVGSRKLGSQLESREHAPNTFGMVGVSHALEGLSQHQAGKHD